MSGGGPVRCAAWLAVAEPVVVPLRLVTHASQLPVHLSHLDEFGNRAAKMMQPGLQPGFHAGPTPMQIKAQMKADMMHVDFLPDSDISDDRVITKYFVSKLDPVPLTTKPEDRERVLDEISERAREHDAECAQMVEHIEPLGAMQELLLDGEEELLSLNGEYLQLPCVFPLLEASQELLRSLRCQRRPGWHVRTVHAACHLSDLSA